MDERPGCVRSADESASERAQCGTPGALGTTDTQSSVEIPAQETTAAERPPSRARRLAAIGGTVAFYTATSIAAVTINRAALRSGDVPPLTFLCAQLAVSVVLLSALGAASERLRPAQPWRWSWALWRAVLPLALSNAAGLALNTLCIAAVDASLYQLGRALVLPCTAAIALCVGQWRGGFSTVLGCVLVVAGFVVGTGAGRTGVPLRGALYAAASALGSAVHAHLGKAATRAPVRPADLLYASNVLSLVLLLPAAAVFERPSISLLKDTPALVAAGVMGVLGTAIGAAGLLQIGLTSAVTHAVVSAGRGVLQVAAARLFLGEAVTPVRCAGIAVALLGAVLYAVSLS